jgi:CMP-N-acetylneuraminic acid synthetase
MKTVAFVPIKLNSERLPMKNIKSFTNGKPLIYYILETLQQVPLIDDIYVYCSDIAIKEYIPSGINFLLRDKYYDLSTTKFNKVLKSFAELIDADTYVLAHATAPFISARSISMGIQKVNFEEYDSAFSVSALQEFIWKDGKPFNYNPNDIPRTQDLEPLLIETCGLYIYSRDLIINKEKRIGDNPFFIQVSQIEACDINTEEDFYMADALYNYGRITGKF